jgi:hypothetical protein
MKAFWLGLGVGVGLGVLTAPKSGRDTRNELWQRMRDRRGSEQSDPGNQVGREKAPSQAEEYASDEGEGKSQREATHDQTLADSFPTSDPPSSIPDPSGDNSAIAS